MATNPPFRYPLDPTGVNPDNLVVGDIRPLVNRPIRAVAPSYGSFFAESLIVKDGVTQATLVRDVQYYIAELFAVPTDRYGKEICGIVVITDPTVTGSVHLTYQTLGGEYSTNSDAVIQMLESLDIDNRPVSWPNIIHKPDAFPPTPHYHDAGDIYGFEYVVHALDRIRQAILTGDDTAHDIIYRYVDESIASVADGADGVLVQLNAHKNNLTNPHSTTAVQVGLGNVSNFLTATQAQAEGGLSADTFMTPLRTKQAINAAVGNAFTSHVNNIGNPHSTTKTQVGLGNVDDFATASAAQAIAGAATNLFVTPSGVAQYVASWAAGSGVGSHISRTDNPHNTTSAQLGLGNVQNYGVSGSADAQAGARNDLYMTPLRVSEAITAQVRNTLTAHINDGNNPHGTNKAQVGLSQVENLAVASQSDAVSGSSNSVYMTPLRVAQYVSNFNSFYGLTNHLSNASNPHNTTAAQVGLGNVFNYGVADNGTAAAAVSTTSYMTPYGVRLAIQALVTSPSWSSLTGKPNSLGGFGIVDGATNGANSNITSLSGLSTPLSVSQGGTGATNAQNARNNLGLIIGQDVQPFNSGLYQISSSGAIFGSIVYCTDLSLSGSITAAGSMALNGNFSVQGSAYAGTVNCANNMTAGTLNVVGAIQAGGDITAFSDERLKTNVKRITGALKGLLSIDGISFERISDGSVSLGVSAQRTMAAFPELVKTNTDGMLSVAYQNFVGPIIEALRELDESHRNLLATREMDRLQIAELRRELIKMKISVPA